MGAGGGKQVSRFYNTAKDDVDVMFEKDFVSKPIKAKIPHKSVQELDCDSCACLVTVTRAGQRVPDGSEQIYCRLVMSGRADLIVWEAGDGRLLLSVFDAACHGDRVKYIVDVDKAKGFADVTQSFTGEAEKSASPSTAESEKQTRDHHRSPDNSAEDGMRQEDVGGSAEYQQTQSSTAEENQEGASLDTRVTLDPQDEISPRVLPDLVSGAQISAQQVKVSNTAVLRHYDVHAAEAISKTVTQNQGGVKGNHGFVFEQHHANSFNRQAIDQGSSLRAQVVPGNQAADVSVTLNGAPVKEAQMKAYKTSMASRKAHAKWQQKYPDKTVQKVVPEGQGSGTLVEAVSVEEVSSTPISRDALDKVRKQHAKNLEEAKANAASADLHAVGSAVAIGAATGVVVGGVQGAYTEYKRQTLCIANLRLLLLQALCTLYGFPVGTPKKVLEATNAFLDSADELLLQLYPQKFVVQVCNGGLTLVTRKLAEFLSLEFNG